MSTSHLFGSLTDGTHTVYVKVTDNAGNSETDSVTFVVDTVAPSLSITAPSVDHLTNLTSVTVSWSGSDLTSDVQGYRYSIDGGAWSSISSDTSHTFTGLGDGNRTVRVQIFDNANLVTLRSITFMVDTVPPVLEITSPSEGELVNDRYITWAASDATSGVAGYQYRADGGAWSTMDLTTSNTFSGLADGNHTVTVRAFDITGSCSYAFVNFTLDATAPTIDITSPADYSISASSTVTVIWEGSDALSGVTGYQYSLDGSAWSVLSNDLSHEFSGLGDDTHTVDIQVWDLAGNNAVDTIRIIVDTAAPGVSISSPADNYISSSTSVTVTWTGIDLGTGLAGYRYKIGSDEFSSLSMTATHTFSGLDQGVHTVVIEAEDNAGNKNSVSVTFNVDTIQPTVSISSPANGLITASSSVQVDWAGSDENSGVWHYRSHIDSVAWSAYSGSLTRTFTSLTTGVHTVYVEVQDNAGNTGSATVSFTVDLVAPSLLITSPAGGSYFNVNTVEVVWTGSDAVTGLQGYTYKVDSEAYSTLSMDISHAFTGLGEGSHTVSVRAHDNVNNIATLTVTFVVDTVAPTVSVTSPTEGQLVNSQAVVWSGNDATSGILNYQSRIDGGSWSSLSATASRTFTGLADGNHMVQVKAFDRAGNYADTFRNFTLDATAPSVVISYPANNAIFNVTTVIVNWNGTDNLAGIAGYQWEIDSGGYSTIAGSSDPYLHQPVAGRAHVHIKATDNASNIYVATVQFRVDTTAPTLTITVPSNNAYQTSTSQTVTWTRSDAGSGLQGSSYHIDGGAWSGIVLATTSNTFTGLTDGVHVVEVRCFDNANLVTTKSVSFTVDTVNPTLVIDNPANLYLTNSTSVTVYWNGSDATAGINGYQYSLDGASFSGTTAPIFHLFSGLSNGNHYVDVKAVDKATRTTTKRVNFTVDNVAPVLTISAPSAGAYLDSTSVAVTWSSTDAVSGVSGYQYRIDSGEWSDKAMVLTNTFTGLSDASHTVDIRAYDVANNIRTASVTFVVDITDPAVSITSPADRALVGIATVDWTGNDATSGIQGYQSRVDNGSWSAVAVTFTRTFVGLADGGHFVEVRAVDRSGNTYTVSVNFTLDMTPPAVAITSPAGGYITNSTTVTVDWTATDSPAGINGYQYRIDAEGWNTLSGAVTNDFSGLSDGLHTVYVKAVDNAGNSATTSVTFRVDTTAPAVSISSPSAGYYSSSATVTVVWTATDGGSGVSGFQYRIDAEDWSVLAWTKTHAFSGLGEGDHTVHIRAMDNASLPSETSVTFNVDTVAPSVQIDSPASNYITNVTTVGVEWSGSDATSGILGYRYKLDTGSWSSISMTATNNFAGLSNLVHTVYVQIYDHANNMAETSVQFTMDNVLPSVAISSPVTGSYTALTSTTVVWSGSDALSGVQGYQYSLDGAEWSSSSMSTSQGFVGLSEGDHTVRVKVTDNAQNAYTVSVTIHVDLTAPVLTISSPSGGAIFNSSTVTVTWSATDASSGVQGYQYQIDGLGWTAVSGTVSHAFTGLGTTSHTVDVRSLDNVGNPSEASVTFIVDVTSPTISITAPTAGENFNITSVLASWTGADVGTGVQGYRYHADALAWSGIVTDLSYTFVLTETTHILYVEVWDNASNHVSASVSVRVDLTAPTLSITAPANNAYQTSTSQTVTWTRSDAGSNVQGSQYRIDEGGWSSIVLATVSHAFGGLTDGVHTVEIRTWDNANNYQTRSVSFTIDTVNPTLVIDNPANLYLTNSTSVTVFWNGSDATAGIQGYQYSLDGASFSGTTAPIFHLFSGLSDGSHYVDVKAVDLAGRTTIKRVNFTVDTVAPVITITAPSASAYLDSSSVTATWSAIDATTSVSGYQCRIDGGAWSEKSMTATTVFNGVADGSHTVDIRAYDQINNLRTSSVTFTVDVTVPTVTISSPTEGALVTSVIVNWNGTDATSGVQGYQSRIDNGSWSVSAMTLTRTFTGLIDGGHFVEVKVTDRSGNFAVTSVHVKLDTSAPTVTITAPASGYNSSSSTVTVNWNGNDVITAIAGYEYHVDAVAWSEMDSAVTTDLSGLADGLHTVYVKAFDLVGNTATASVTFRVDTVKPGITITSPAGGYYSPSSSVKVDWTGTDSGSGIQGYQYCIDGLAWSSVSSSVTNTFTGLSEGDHTVQVRAIDRAGNQEETSVTFNVDTVAPTVGITGPMEGLNTNSTTVSVFWTGEDATSLIKGYQYKIDTGSWSGTSLGLTHDFAGLLDGTHTVYVKAIDNADNEATATVHFIVDTVVPALAISAPVTGSYTGSTSVTVFWNGSDATSGILGYQYALDGAEWSSTGLGLTQVFAGLSEGDHIFSVRATDNAQNHRVVSVTVHVDLTAPALVIGSPTEGAIFNSSTVTVSWSCDGPELRREWLRVPRRRTGMVRAVWITEPCLRRPI